jgi:hypothetical protein
MHVNMAMHVFWQAHKRECLGGGGGGGLTPLPWVKNYRTGVQDRYVCWCYLKFGF